MPKTNKVILSLNAGELSPLMDSRLDQDKYKFGCRIMENFYPLIYGGCKRRPGGQYIATQKSSSAKGRAIAFEHSVDDTYILLFENQGIRVFTGGSSPARVTGTAQNVDDVTLSSTDPVSIELATHGYITGDIVSFAEFATGGCEELNGEEYSITKSDANNFTLDGTDSSAFTAHTTGGEATWSGITTPYLTADLFDLDIKQSADVMYITHSDYEERKLSRTGDTNWTLVVLAFEDGPFNEQNTTMGSTIAVAEISGGGIAKGASVTLTASGFTPFLVSTTAGHVPSGALVTSKSQTGALFKLVYGIADDSIDDKLENTNDVTSELTVYKGVTWDFTTQATWTGTVKLEREYNNSGVWETIVTVVSIGNKNVTTSGTEEFEDAQYRIKMYDGSSTDCQVQFSVRDSSHIGIVKITAVNSTTEAIATVLTGLGTVDDTAVAATYRWSEGRWSNYRGWPITVDISPEERLTFGGSVSYPLTEWGSIIGNFTSMKAGILDDDAITFTLIGSGQQNRIQWMLPKTAMMIGTVGGEHLLGSSDEKEALTPTNVQAKLQTTYGSAKVAALIVNQAILFVQRGARKIRELLYGYEADAYKADDLTVFSHHITESGITDMAFQRTPDPMLWCVRDDGEMAVMVYERDQNVYSWCRAVTDGEYESVAVIYGGAGNEDEVWATVKREIGGSDARYLERFTNQNFDQLDEVMFLDSAVVNESAYAPQDVVLASDTVRCNNGLCNSSLCGGTTA